MTLKVAAVLSALAGVVVAFIIITITLIVEKHSPYGAERKPELTGCSFKICVEGHVYCTPVGSRHAWLTLYDIDGKPQKCSWGEEGEE